MTLFFLGLGMAFAVAVWLRVRSYDGLPEAAVPSKSIAGGTSTAPVPVTEGPAVPASDTGVIVERTASVAEAERARERRYNELLHEPPPQEPEGRRAASTVAPPTPPSDRSLLTRVAEAVGISRPKPPPSSQRQPPPDVSRPAQPPPSSSSSPASKDPLHSEAEDDPDSDIVPPQLIGVEFLPPSVQDGETTTLAVTAMDNLSGVRSVSGVIGSPTGTVQGFACQREGDSNRYTTRITVPKDAASGMWILKYLTLTDNASNSANLTASQGALPATASFRVTSSDADTTAPSLKAVWVDRPAMRAGDRNTVFVQADDDKTGVTAVNGVFVSPGKQARLAFGCRLGSTGAWECPLTPPACLDCGLWHLEQLQLQDKANNMTTIRAENPLIRPVVVDISGDACDSAPPALSMLTLDPVVVSNLDGGEIQVRATIADDGCGVASLSGQAVPQGGVGGQHAYFSMQASGDGRTFIGTLTVQKHAAKGLWSVAWLQALDKGHNLRAYSANDPIIARATFRVE